MRAGKYPLFGLVSLALLVATMQFAMVSVALPDIIEDLDAPLRWVGWVITIFTLAQAVSMPIVGKLSDELGRRTVFAGGLATFAIASLICTLAPNVYVLIVARAVQGMAGGSLLPSAYGVIGDAFGENSRDRAQAIGLLSSVFPMGVIIGPNLGGVIVDNFGWRWTFAINVPSGLTIAAAALLLLPAGRRTPSRRIDFLGAGLLSMAVAALIYSLTELAQSEDDPNPVIVSVGFLVAVAGALLFLRRESRTPDPVLDLTLLKQREFAFVNTLNFFYGVVVFGAFSFIPLYAQSAYGMSSAESGVLLTPRAAGMIVVSAMAAMLLPRTGYRKPIVAGLLVMAGSLAILSLGAEEPQLADIRLANFPYLTLVVALGGLGLGVAGPATNNAAIELAPERIAAITGLRGMFRLLGGSIGTTLIVLVISRADSTAEGLETAFLGLAVLSALTTVFVLGIPDKVGAAVPVAQGQELDVAPAPLPRGPGAHPQALPTSPGPPPGDGAAQ